VIVTHRDRVTNGPFSLEMGEKLKKNLFYDIKPNL
jgi:hypothetical protein